MSVNRPTVGEPHVYKGSVVTATLISPDLIGYLDGLEMPHFYMTLAAVRVAGEKMVDAKLKEQGDKKHARRRSNR